MFLTITLSIIIMFAVVLMIVSGVDFIQNKRLFTSAPQDIQDAIVPDNERFRGAHLIGWILDILSVLIIIFSILYAFIDGINHNWKFCRFS
ncbi:hypothetical protein [Methanobrevibacter sp. V74]|uniref:hypothetical protein n=1 Tax=Methanobrevibacter sp. V74 TaxID=3064279 RepID=UPI002733F4F4|nr:hypothetical protein [Methanobrevibacter sp. V74]